MYDLLNEEGLYTRDKVEIIWAFWCAGHSGNSPSYEDVATVLKVSRGNIQSQVEELRDQGRLIQVDGKYTLKNSEYTHPIVRELDK